MFLDDNESILRIRESYGVTLEFERTYPYGPDDPYVFGILLRASADHLHLEQQVILLSPEGLSDFFRGLYDEFRGWTGERTWHSLNDELCVTARHDGHIRLRWEVSDRQITESSWTFATTTSHDAGEDMRHLADAFAVLLTDPR